MGVIYDFQYVEFNNNPDNGGQYPIYGANGIIGGYTNYNAESSSVIGHMGAYAGYVVEVGEDAPKYSGYNQSLTTVATYMALFFASDEAAFVTSQIVTVDGGMMSHAPINTALRKLAENTK